jgi:uracil-DNA glycosylase
MRPLAAHRTSLQCIWTMNVDIPRAWHQRIAQEVTKPYFRDLAAFVDEERRKHVVFPAEADMWTTFGSTPFDAVRVVWLGQDPYPTAGQAHGLSFSVKHGQKTPASLANMFREATTDVPGFVRPAHGCLDAWAQQGVLLLNTILTVREGEAGSHRGKGWETFTDTVITTLSGRDKPMVFVLLGLLAQKKEALIDTKRHPVIKATHPSPLSAHQGFFGSKPYSAVNAALQRIGEAEVDWRLV